MLFKGKRVQKLNLPRAFLYVKRREETYLDENAKHTQEMMLICFSKVDLSHLWWKIRAWGVAWIIQSLRQV